VDGKPGGQPPLEAAAATASSLTTYLYVNKKRVIGLVSAEAIQKAYRLESSYERSTEARRAVLGIHQIWVHSKFRGRGVATQLLDAVRDKMVFNFAVPCRLLAFSSPTEAGIAFARSYVSTASLSESTPVISPGRQYQQQDDVLVYDCH